MPALKNTSCRLCIVSILLTITSFASADTIVMNDGKRIQGQIQKVGTNANGVNIRTTAGSMTIPRSRI
jgi:hypothetical protein